MPTFAIGLKSTPKLYAAKGATMSCLKRAKSAALKVKNFATLAEPRSVIAQYAIRQSFASGNALLMNRHNMQKTPNGAVAEMASASMKLARRRQTSILAGQLWRRGLHTGGCPDCRRIAQKEASTTSHLTTIRSESTKHEGQKPHYVDKPPSSHTKPVDPPPIPSAQEGGEPHSYFHPPDMQNLHLPKLPHRPTKQELLEAASGFWSRLRVRFKWLTIRSVRLWNVDDWSAFVSWFVVGHIVWILVGTTTFISALIYAINTIAAQGMFRH